MHPMSRRALLGATAAAALSACSGPSKPNGGASARPLPNDLSKSVKKLSFGNWPNYLARDEKTGKHPSLVAFEKSAGIAVDYKEDIEDGASYFAKIAPQLRANQNISRDLIVMPDWTTKRMIDQGLIQPFNKDVMSHATKNLLPAMGKPPYDPENTYSFPWQGGLTGIGYDASKVKGDIKSVEDLWRADLKGKVVAVADWRDTIGIILKSQGVDPSKEFTDEQFQKALDVVSKQLHGGQIRQIKGSSYIQDLANGNAHAGIIWSGDIATLREETGNKNWKFVVPDSGAMLWTDNAVIPMSSHQRTNASRLLDFFYDPTVAAKEAKWGYQPCPVVGAQKFMEALDSDLAKDPFVFPTTDWLTKNTSVFRAVQDEKDANFATAWSKVLGR